MSTLALAAMLGISATLGDAAAVPIAPGVRFVIAVSDRTTPARGQTDLTVGDYEVVVSVDDVTSEGVTHTTLVDGVDIEGRRRRVEVSRLVTSADLAGAPVQVLGFHSRDPQTLPHTTSLGPSRHVVRELVRTGTATYAFRNYADRGVASGTLRLDAQPVRFSVLLNGSRVALKAVRATGEIAVGNTRRPFETIVLDHPLYPLSLRIAYGAANAAELVPVFTREIVRIDLPTSPDLTAAALTSDCRIELSGLYFDFNRATLKPESEPALLAMAAALKAAPNRHYVIEGHTDNVGTDAYNDRLSIARAAAVQAALVADPALDGNRFRAVGHGSRRPVESNATLAGRARNRRVELVCLEGSNENR